MDNYSTDNFLVNYRQGIIEKHSDSSEFDETEISPRVSSNGGKHRFLDKELETSSKTKRKVIEVTSRSSANKQHMNPNVTIYDDIPERDYDVTNQRYKRINKRQCNISRSRGDDLPRQQTINQSQNLESKPVTFFPTSLKRTNNCTKQISSSKDVPQDNLNNGEAICPDCERRRIKKLNRCRRSYAVQPVYAVDNIQGEPVPFGHANDRAPLSQHIHKSTRKQDSNASYELTSSESEIGNKINKNQGKSSHYQRNFIDRFQKEMRKEYIKYEKELIRNRAQQYPSKRDNNSPYQVFSNPYCQTTNEGAAQYSDHSNIPSTSSGFWEYLFEKIRGKRHPDKDDVLKPCTCPVEGKDPALLNPLPSQQTSYVAPKNWAQQENLVGNATRAEYYSPVCKNCMQQTEDIKKESAKTLTPNKSTQGEKGGKQNCKCKSNPNNNQKQTVPKNSQKSLPQKDEAIKPCQEPHDDIAKAVGKKYNGEILCIHNPPCILINGCLKLPKTDRHQVQGNFWPITQDKKSSFYNMFRKMKRPKNNCEQACQYHQPRIEVQHGMEIKAEKLVQSICNHDPPCEVVYGCYKAKHDPKLDNSCIHVPMCHRLPQCMMEERQDNEKQDTIEGNLCEHKPKCLEVPLCSRKFLVLTAKDTVGTQVRPKKKLVCRHEPPCIMIPKCLARIISDSCIPYEAIPDCVHQPSCDMIPACCRKAAKEMVSVSSQYPNAPCRIV